MSKTPKIYPKVLFVQSQGDGADEFLLADHDATSESFEDGKIAVYERVAVKERSTNVTLK